jgi:hypothetical protein
VSALRKFLTLSWSSRLLLLEAFFFLAAARAALVTLPFRRLTTLLGRQSDELPRQAPDGPAPAQARAVAGAVERMARRTPWESACLTQAIAAQFMLQRRQLSSLLCLGTRIDTTGKLVAHAWLRYGNEILLGGADHQSFTLLSAFGEPPS